MKIGDKVICIKDHGLFEVVLIKGKTYEIINIDMTSRKPRLHYIQTTSENIPKYWSIYDSGLYYKFSEYFISISEFRKQKLNKINKNNEV